MILLLLLLIQILIMIILLLIMIIIILITKITLASRRVRQLRDQHLREGEAGGPAT